MPQLQWPIFPEGTTLIAREMACECRPGKVTYVHGHLPVFQHAQQDVAAFRYFTSQLVVPGAVGQADIARAFHVPKVTVKRSVKRFREGSGKDFFPRPRRRSASVLKGEVKEKAQALLDEGQRCRRWPRRWRYCRTLCAKPFVASACIRPKKESSR
jgi:hypothetical protein